jgi:16S rRNA (guanine527-N7)-methyltransferase
VVADVAQQLGLKNVKAECVRCETLSEKYDFITSRAVAPTPELLRWNHKNISKLNKNKLLNGFLFLKGGDLSEELKTNGYRTKTQPLSAFFKEPFFEEKKLIYLSNF